MVRIELIQDCLSKANSLEFPKWKENMLDDHINHLVFFKCGKTGQYKVLFNGNGSLNNELII